MIIMNWNRENQICGECQKPVRECRCFWGDRCDYPLLEERDEAAARNEAEEDE